MKEKKLFNDECVVRVFLFVAKRKFFESTGQFIIAIGSFQLLSKAVDGVCGESCGFDTKRPPHCEYGFNNDTMRGSIPRDMLVYDDKDEDDDLNGKKYVFTKLYRVRLRKGLLSPAFKYYVNFIAS